MCRPCGLRIQDLFRGAELWFGAEGGTGKPDQTRSPPRPPHLLNSDYDPEGKWGKSCRGSRQDLSCHPGEVSPETAGRCTYGSRPHDRLGTHFITGGADRKSV